MRRWWARVRRLLGRLLLVRGRCRLAGGRARARSRSIAHDDFDFHRGEFEAGQRWSRTPEQSEHHDMDRERHEQQRNQELFVVPIGRLRNRPFGRRTDFRRQVVVSRARAGPDEWNDVAEVENDRRGAIRRRFIEIDAAQLDQRCLHYNTRSPTPEQ